MKPAYFELSVISPDEPGIDGWYQSCRRARDMLHKLMAHLERWRAH